MRELGIYEAGTQFAALLALMKRGEIKPTRSGEVVAGLVPRRAARERARVDNALAAVQARMQAEGAPPFDAATIKARLHEGRR